MDRETHRARGAELGHQDLLIASPMRKTAYNIMVPRIFSVLFTADLEGIISSYPFPLESSFLG
ncbi:MAG TPA: hypothetical protein DIT46_09435 [Gemmatimonadetes bacterium]|nr:hypothetical protein [Gemmatimonadota bacterium]